MSVNDLNTSFGKMLMKRLFVWVEEDAHQNHQIEMAIERVQQFAPHTYVITNYKECERWLIQYNGSERISLIISNKFGMQIIPHVHHLPSIDTIYMNFPDPITKYEVTRKYSKILSVDSDMNFLTGWQQMQAQSDDFSYNDLHGTDSGFSEASSDKEKSLEKSIEREQGGRTNFHFIIIDITQRLSRKAYAMLMSLVSMANSPITIFHNSLDIDFNKLPKKTTFLFASRQFVDTLKSKSKQIEAIFVLENDPNNADQQKRFTTGEHFIFQLADELYRCYKNQAQEYRKSGYFSIAKMKEELANRIHEELKEAYKSVLTDENNITAVVDTTVIVIWLKSERYETEVKELQDIIDNIVSSFQTFDSEVACQSYLQINELYGVVYLIINTDYGHPNVATFQQLSNVKTVYLYGQGSLDYKTVIKDYNDLCFELISDLAGHYNKLGSACSAKQDPKTARDMFSKTAELYRILSRF